MSIDRTCPADRGPADRGAADPLPPRRARRGCAAGLGLLAALAAGVALAPPAAAHAALVSSDPTDGSTLDSAPTSVTLTFSEPMQDPAYVVITAPDGTRSAAEAELDGSVVTQVVPSSSAGTFTVAFRVVSEDGHPVSDELHFVVGDAGSTGGSTSVAPGEETSGDPNRPVTGDAADADDVGASAGSSSRSSGGSELVDGIRLWQVAVGAGLFAGAGVLLVAARRTRG